MVHAAEINMHVQDLIERSNSLQTGQIYQKIQKAKLNRNCIVNVGKNMQEEPSQ